MLALGLALAAALFASPASAAAAEAQVRGDAKAGESIYGRCLACHAIDYDRTGPRHCGLFGRRAGSVKGFAYSDAMKRSKVSWDEKTLDRFIADPPGTIPGTTMGYAGVKDPKERADLIAYLKHAGRADKCQPPT